MRQLIGNAWAWILDYGYVTWIELLSLFVHPSIAKYKTPYRSGGFNKTEIVLIPGVYEDWRFMKSIADHLHAHGYKIHVLEGLGRNRGAVETMAALATDYVRKNIQNDYLLVSHSKGGLVGKYMLIDPNASNRLKGLIALNAPFSGSIYAYLLPPLPSLRIFKPHSKILNQLAENTSRNSQIVSIYGTFDPHIPGGSFLNGAKNVQLKTKGHFKILDDKVVLKAIIDGIDYLSATASK